MTKRKPEQILLGLAAPKRSAGAERFAAETRRRGGPYEIQGKRWLGNRARREAQAEEMGEGGWARMVEGDAHANADVILGMHGLVKKMPKVESDD